MCRTISLFAQPLSCRLVYFDASKPVGATVQSQPLRIATVGDEMASLGCIDESAIVCHLHIGGGGCVQVVAYTILDIISKVVFSFMIVSAHDSLGSSSQPQVQSREYV